jgi:1,4-alpha-glucan branching enzyme
VPGGAALLRRANAEARRIPGALLVAEDLKGYAAVTAGAGDGQGLGFDTQWDGGFSYALTSAVLGTDDGARNIAGVRDALYGRYNGDPFQRVIYTETHDTVGNGGARLPSRIDPKDPQSFAARKRSLLAAAVLMTAPGIPMLFQGQEMLSVGGFADPPLPLD